MTFEYVKAPIESATIRVQFHSEWKSKALEATKEALSENFDDVKPVFRFQLKTQKDGTPKYKRKVAGYQFFSSDKNLYVILTRRTLQVTQSGAYRGWDALSDRFKDVLKKIGVEEIKFLGTVYNNKISLSFDEKKRIELNDYFNVFLSDTEFDGSVGFFDFQTSLTTLKEGYTSNLHCKAAPTEVVGVCAFDLDIEITSMNERISDLDTELNELRVVKDHVFESLITDSTRELFQ